MTTQTAHLVKMAVFDRFAGDSKWKFFSSFTIVDSLLAILLIMHV